MYQYVFICTIPLFVLVYGKISTQPTEIQIWVIMMFGEAGKLFKGEKTNRIGKPFLFWGFRPCINEATIFIKVSLNVHFLWAKFPFLLAL